MSDIEKILLLSGHICTGKTEVTRRLEDRFGFVRIKTSEILKCLAPDRGFETDRIPLQELGEELDRETSGRWVLDEVVKWSKANASHKYIVIDSVRIKGQIDWFRNKFGLRVIHAHLTAPPEILEARFEERKELGREHDKGLTFQKATMNKTERDIDFLRDEADIVIDTERTDAGDTLVRIVARFNLYSPPFEQLVDVIVGGQYGSEGKGHVAAYLARDYDVLVRVGGPNAGHKVAGPTGAYTYHHLPSGCRDVDAQVLIGPGAVLNYRTLLKEIEECGIVQGRIFIDPRAMIIEEEDVRGERSLVEKIGSTGQGVGLASARKITNRWEGGVRLARDISALKPFIGETYEHLERAYSAKKKILLEGTQGSGLSIHHGDYPHVTSRDTNVAGCLSEAGISPSRVRRILMVVRTYPIRVASPKKPGMHSGPMKQELTLDIIAARSKLELKLLQQTEKTSTTKKDRRIGEFDWELFRKACALNAPTDIALTFADYICAENQKARRFDQLTAVTIRFVEELERVSHAPVSLINTRFDHRSVIDRRDWR